MRIANNIAALNANKNLQQNSRKKSKAMEKLSSGLRINQAGDDAAGLAISEKMRAQIRGLNAAARNTLDGISLIQTAEGALSETHAIVQRMRELTAQAANDTNTVSDRQAIALEVSRLIEETDKILTNTDFNTKKLFMGLDATPVTFQIGANAGETFDLFITKSLIPSYGYFVWEAPGLIIGAPGNDLIIDLTTHANASLFLTVLDKAIVDVSNERANLGAAQNRLEHTLANLQTAEENTAAAESRIRDTDMSKGMFEFTKNQILQQAAVAMLAQANQVPQGVLELLK